MQPTQWIQLLVATFCITSTCAMLLDGKMLEFGDDDHHEAKVMHHRQKIPYPVVHRVPEVHPYKVPVPIKPVVITVKVPELIEQKIPYKIPVKVPVPYEVKVPYHVRVPYIVKVPVYIEKGGYKGSSQDY